MVAGLYDAAAKLIPFLGASAIGAFILHEISRRLAFSTEERKHLGRALAELLEIRYWLVSMTEICRAVEIEIAPMLGGQLPPQLKPALYAMAPRFVPTDWAGMRARYNEAVSAIAGVRPVLAYRLRSKEAVGSTLEQFGAIALGDERAIKIWTALEEAAVTQAPPILADAVRELAWKHGVLTWWQTRRTLRRQDHPDAKAQAVIQQGIERISATVSELIAADAARAQAMVASASGAVSPSAEVAHGRPPLTPSQETTMHLE